MNRTMTSRHHDRTAPTRRGRRTTMAVLLASAASTLVLAACSSSTDDDPSTAPAANSTTGSKSATAETSASGPAAESPAAGTPITITAGGQTFKATLNNSQVARDFAEMLPVTLPWFRNAGIEYITELDAPLTETGPFYTDVQPGDLVYYNPLDSITIIYKETGSVPTLTKMGEITSSDLDAFENLPEKVDMRIEAG